jgi:hypothetical protein
LAGNGQSGLSGTVVPQILTFLSFGTTVPISGTTVPGSAVLNILISLVSFGLQLGFSIWSFSHAPWWILNLSLTSLWLYFLALAPKLAHFLVFLYFLQLAPEIAKSLHSYLFQGNY